MISKYEFLLKYMITEDTFKAAQISWETLTGIYDDYSETRMKICKEAGDDFLHELFENPRNVGLHSIYWRIKEPEHLIAKIIRRKNTNYKNYKDIDECNYWKIVMDLIGFRGLMVFKEDWPTVHRKLSSYMESNSHLCLEKAPKALVRDGDNKELYSKYLGSEHVISKQSYRSVHYKIKYKEVYLELQLRTLFEEALGEMDHQVRYPNQETDEKLSQYAGMMNHLVGVADELGSFYLKLSRENKKEPETIMLCQGEEEKAPQVNQKKKTDESRDTVRNCLNNVLKK